MILSQILYQKKTESQNVVILILGRKGNKLAAILDAAISKRDAEEIINNSKLLDEYPLHNKMSWVKQHVPNSYKNGYREFILNKVTVKRSYSLTNKEYVKTTSKGSV